jgi:hypothetical protein
MDELEDLEDLEEEYILSGDQHVKKGKSSLPSCKSLSKRKSFGLVGPVRDG